MEDFIIGDLKKPEPPPAVVPAAVMESYPGKYRAVTTRFAGTTEPEQVEIRAGDGELLFHRQGRTYRLLPVTEQLFRYPGESMATAAFVRDPAGQLYFQDDSGNFVRIETPE